MPSQGPLPPGPRAPRAWQIARYQREPIAYVEACARRHGPVFTLRLPFAGTFVGAVDPRDVQTILTLAPERFPDGPGSSPIGPIMGESALMFSTGDAHRHQRRTLRPVLGGARLAERWGDEIAAIAAAELDRLPVGVPVATLPAARRIAVEVLCRLVLGPMDPHDFARLREEIGRRDDPRLVLMLQFPTLWRRGGRLNPGRALKRRRDLVNRMLLAQIAARRAASPGAGEPADVLSLLVTARDEHGEPLGDAAIRDQLVGLLVVGHETTAAALAWALERVSRAPRVRERLADELASGQTAYLDAVVRETLRLRPPIADALRTATAPIELGGHAIAPGTAVSAMCANAQRDGATWGDPLAFRPERFLEDPVAPYAFVPFGGGARRCVAAALATLIVQSVVRVAVERALPTAAPGGEECARLYGLSLMPSRGARVVLRPRAHSVRSSSTSGGRVASQLG